MSREPKHLPDTLRRRIPLSVINSDMTNGCVPRSYLQSLMKPGMTSNTCAADLLPCRYSEAFGIFRSSVSTKASTTFIVQDSDCFVALATEALLCGIASVGVVDPAQIARSYIQSIALGQSNDFVCEYISTIGVLFLDSVMAPVVTGYLQSSPEAAYHFFSFMKVSRYGVAQHIVMDMSAHYRSQPKDRVHLSDAVAQAYGYDTANLLLDTAHVI